MQSDIHTTASYFGDGHTERTERPPTHKFVKGSVLHHILKAEFPAVGTEVIVVNYLTAFEAINRLVERQRDNIWYLFSGNATDPAHCPTYFKKRADCWRKATEIALGPVLAGRRTGEVSLAQLLEENLEELPSSGLLVPAL
jgi:hypothetical protein